MKTFILLAAALAVSACGSITNAIDCNKVCDRYRTCFNSSYDVSACAARCRTDSANDANYQHQADVCSTCITDQSCASATFGCATSCGTIVP